MLVLILAGAERILLGVATLVHDEGGPGLGLPDLAFLVREVVPDHADDLGEGAMVALDG